MDAKSRFQTPSWLDETAFDIHRRELSISYQLGYLTSVSVGLHSFFERFSYERLEEEPDIELLQNQDDVERPHVEGSEIDYSELYNFMEQRGLLEDLDSVPEPFRVLEEIRNHRDRAIHSIGHYSRPPVDDEGFLNDTDLDYNWETSIDEAVRLYEEIAGVPEEESINNYEMGRYELDLHDLPEENIDTRAVDLREIDPALIRHSEASSTNLENIEQISYSDSGEDYLLALVHEMYSGRGISSIEGTTSVMMRNWFENIFQEVDQDTLEEIPVDNIEDSMGDFTEISERLAHDINSFQDLNGRYSQQASTIQDAFDMFSYLNRNSGWWLYEREIRSTERTRSRFKTPY